MSLFPSLKINDVEILSKFRLCIQIPFAGGRVFEIGDEKLLNLGLKGEPVDSFVQTSDEHPLM